MKNSTSENPEKTFQKFRTDSSERRGHSVITALLGRYRYLGW